MLIVSKKWRAGLCAGVALVAASNYAHSSNIVTLNASSNASTNTLVGTNTAINFTATGQPYVFYPIATGTGGSGAAAVPEEKSSAPSAFSTMTDTVPSSSPSGRSSTATSYAGFTATVTVTDGTLPAPSFTANGYTYVGVSAPTITSTNDVGDGLSFGYSIPALTTETINVLVYTQNTPNVRMAVSDSTGTIYDDGPAGIVLNNGGGSFKGGGIYSFNMTNTSASADPLTFSYTFAGYSNETATTEYLGLEGAYVDAAPEPASFGLLALSCCGMLLRRRRTSRVAG